MQLEATLVISVVSGILSLSAAIILFLGKVAVTREKEELERRFGEAQADLAELRKKHDELGSRLGGRCDTLEAEDRKQTERAHAAELAAEKLRGEIRVLEARMGPGRYGSSGSNPVPPNLPPRPGRGT